MSNPTLEGEVSSIKEHRRDIDNQIKRLRLWPATRERAIAFTKLQEAQMWLGMDLKRIGEAHPELLPNPYPNSKDPSNSVIDRTAPEIS
jgi:hypothetical protein